MVPKIISPKGSVWLLLHPRDAQRFSIVWNRLRGFTAYEAWERANVLLDGTPYHATPMRQLVPYPSSDITHIALPRGGHFSIPPECLTGEFTQHERTR